MQRCKNPECKNKFTIDIRPKKVYCSAKCAQRGSRLNILERNRIAAAEICRYCGTPLLRKKQRIFCCKKCAIRFDALMRVDEHKLYAEKRREILHVSYLKNVFNQIGIKNPTPEMIEEKRLSIKLKRLINEKSRQINPR